MSVYMRACQEFSRLSLYLDLFLLSFDVENTGLSTDRTSVCLVGCYRRPRFCLPLWPTRGRFVHLWLKSIVPDTHTCSCLCSLVNTWDTTIMEIHCVLKFPPRIYWLVPYEMHNLHTGTSFVFLTDWRNFSTFRSLQPVEGQPDCPSPYNRSFTTFEWRKRHSHHSIIPES
jgi:hypothetical protein